MRQCLPAVDRIVYEVVLTLEAMMQSTVSTMR